MTITAKQIVFLRKTHRLTQDALAREIGYSRSYLRTIELGKVKPSRRFIEALSSKFGIPIDDLLFEFGGKILNALFTIPRVSGNGFVFLYDFTARGLAQAEKQLTDFLESSYKYELIDGGRIKSLNHFYSMLTGYTGPLENLIETFKLSLWKQYKIFIVRQISSSKFKGKAILLRTFSDVIGSSGGLIVVDKPSFLERNIQMLYDYAHPVHASSTFGKIHSP